MSGRGRRGRRGPRRGEPRREGREAKPPPAPERRRAAGPQREGLLAQGGFLIAVFAGVTLLAWVVGAANLGVAMGIGQVAFAVALVYVLVRR